MKDYEVFIAGDVYHRLESVSKRERKRLKSVILGLGENPESKSNDITQDRIGRTIDIHFHGNFAIHYWIDHADQHVKVTEIRPHR